MIHKSYSWLELSPIVWQFLFYKLQRSVRKTSKLKETKHWRYLLTDCYRTRATVKITTQIRETILRLVNLQLPTQCQLFAKSKTFSIYVRQFGIQLYWKNGTNLFIDDEYQWDVCYPWCPNEFVKKSPIL
jgi:hypothetical protein